MVICHSQGYVTLVYSMLSYMRLYRILFYCASTALSLSYPHKVAEGKCSVKDSSSDLISGLFSEVEGAVFPAARTKVSMGDRNIMN